MAENNRSMRRAFRSVVFFLPILVSVSIAQKHEEDLLGQLYHEIIRSAPKGEGADSMLPELEHEQLPDAVKLQGEGILTGKNSERLSQEIESMVREANERHNESVRFMIDTK